MVFRVPEKFWRRALMRNGHLAACLLLFTLSAGVRTYHYSWWSDNPQPFLEAIRKAEAAPPPALVVGERICAGIVTHHFLASGLMVRFFATLQAKTSPETILLIGPNHFHHGLANISLSSLPWKTPFGGMETDPAIVQQVGTATHLPKDPDAFMGEHSVGVLIPFLKYYFPKSRVVPILVDVNAQERPLEELRGLISAYLGNPKCLVLLSMDFSHNSGVTIADSRDVQAQQAISSLDPGKAEGLNVDCPKGLWLLLASLRDLGQIKVQISEHSNSARLTGNLRQPDVTSYFSVFFTR
jgi:AmmeMemoRadiSam system protein B